jgi:signal transduction histidine kinase
MALNRPTVLILSADPAFARELAAEWPAEPLGPEFTVLDKNLFSQFSGSHYDLAIVDANADEVLPDLRRALAVAAKPAIIIIGDIGDDGLGSACCQSLPRSTKLDGSMIQLNRRPASAAETSESHTWAAIAGLLGREILRRSNAETRLRAAESAYAAAEAQATLGRYMIEMRHNINNALTSVLGNAELLALEPGLPAKAIAEADTVRNMALRLHEVFQRFSSIEKELAFSARDAGKNPFQAGSADR